MENKNRSASPLNEETTDRVDSKIDIYTGLTKREWFAGMAMQGLLASFNSHSFNTCQSVAHHAIQFADTLIDELSKPQL